MRKTIAAVSIAAALSLGAVAPAATAATPAPATTTQNVSAYGPAMPAPSWYVGRCTYPYTSVVQHHAGWWFYTRSVCSKGTWDAPLIYWW
jgi:hypothetical protein